MADPEIAAMAGTIAALAEAKKEHNVRPGIQHGQPLSLTALGGPASTGATSLDMTGAVDMISAAQEAGTAWVTKYFNEDGSTKGDAANDLTDFQLKAGRYVRLLQRKRRESRTAVGRGNYDHPATHYLDSLYAKTGTQSLYQIANVLAAASTQLEASRRGIASALGPIDDEFLRRAGGFY